MFAQHNAPIRQTTRKHRWGAVMLVASAISIAAAIGARMLHGGPFSGAALWLIWVAIAAFAVSLIAAFPTVNELYDEVRMRAHLDAWFWGGSIGLCLIVFVTYAAILLGADGMIDSALSQLASGVDHPLVLTFGLGVAAAVAPILLGYAVWWAAWWLRRR